MATATIVRAWTDGTTARMAVRVTESYGDAEYIGAVPMDDEWQAMSGSQRRAALLAACKARRDSLQAQATDLGYSGTATV